MVDIRKDDQFRRDGATDSYLYYSFFLGERRIRVLTLALPVTSSLSELYASADQVAIATLLANKAVERGMNSKLDDARDALTNKCVDILGVYKTHLTASSSGATPNLQICDNLKLLPLLTLGMLKHVSKPLSILQLYCATLLVDKL